MGSGFAKRKKEAKRMQEQMQAMQEKMKEATATGTAGGGLVSITLNGEHEMTKISIKPDCVDPEDVEGLEDLIRAAYSDAKKELEKETPSLGKMGGLPF
ncbi:MAG: Nucleoid-associated protein [Chlamydiales bacterium]|nr:Nucleoid-associated protein [Chlamydiales bacterium]MCH9635468.1 Nucleoid-associated protein [Chlamydiales bacterium]